MDAEHSLVPDAAAGFKVYELLFGLIVSQGIYVAAKLGIADLIAKTPMNADELAAATNTHPQSLRRMLEMLASKGVFTEGKDGTFHNSPMSATLCSDAQPSMRDTSLMLGARFVRNAWGELLDAVCTGEPAFERIHGMSLFSYLLANPEDAAVLSAGMTSGSSLDVAAVIAAYDFSKFHTIVDVGGSHGALLAGILGANPNLHAILADMPPVVASADLLRKSAVADRCEFAGIDFFQTVPQGGDAYILKWVIHDWSDDDALKILHNCRRAIKPEGTLLLIEHILKPANEFDLGRMLDVGVMTLAKGRERTEREYQQLLQSAGFALRRVIATGALLSIIESTPV